MRLPPGALKISLKQVQRHLGDGDGGKMRSPALSTANDLEHREAFFPLAR
jgi:hypothetical protein